jgi:2-iminoacetate synthase
MKSFKDFFEKYQWDEVKTKLEKVTLTDVEKSLQKKNKTIDDFLNFLSPVASQKLEVMAKMTQQLTQKRFGKTIQLYAPLYLSNECQNICTYCGFSLDNSIKRKTLSDTEILIEASVLKSMGVNHVLLVSGEANKTVGIDYFLNAIQLLKPHFANISIEVQPLSEEEYRQLHEAEYMLFWFIRKPIIRKCIKNIIRKEKSRISNFVWKHPTELEKPEFIKWDSAFYWGWKIGGGQFFQCLTHRLSSETILEKQIFSFISAPRPAEGIIEPNFIMSDRDLLQLICAYRIWNEDLEISISTRENEKFRNNIISLGATAMSAASKPIREVMRWIKNRWNSLKPVMKEAWKKSKISLKKQATIL